jgi:hypothetical protein
MTKEKKSSKRRPQKSVTRREQNPAATDVRSLAKAVAGNKDRKKKK